LRKTRIRNNRNNRGTSFSNSGYSFIKSQVGLRIELQYNLISYFFTNNFLN